MYSCEICGALFLFKIDWKAHYEGHFGNHYNYDNSYDVAEWSYHDI